mmetsp:Transcript_9485/g.39001  ORF Transcript_9485/g.39001 Transcript_9485/m.39001 type:complete len:201 (-) Transcript_9485:203-805(-)
MCLWLSSSWRSRAMAASARWTTRSRSCNFSSTLARDSPFFSAASIIFWRLASPTAVGQSFSSPGNSSVESGTSRRSDTALLVEAWSEGGMFTISKMASRWWFAPSALLWLSSLCTAASAAGSSLPAERSSISMARSSALMSRHGAFQAARRSAEAASASAASASASLAAALRPPLPLAPCLALLAFRMALLMSDCASCTR